VWQGKVIEVSLAGIVVDGQKGDEGSPGTGCQTSSTIGDVI